MNRQLSALDSTIGNKKAKVMANRLKDINPQGNITYFSRMWSKESDFINLKDYNYVIDAIDSFKDKIDLIEQCVKNEINIISSMGAGGRLKGDLFELSDISKTYNDPLAKKVRVELRKRGINNLKVVFSSELPIKAKEGCIGSAICAVSSAGLLMAQQALSYITGT